MANLCGEATLTSAMRPPNLSFSVVKGNSMRLLAKIAAARRETANPDWV